MQTLVVCVDRTGDVPAKTGADVPLSGRAAVESLVVDLGVADPEDSAVNALLETLRVAEDIDGESDVAVVSGGSDSVVNADRAVAAQVDELLATHDPESVVIVIDSAEDERLVPIIESRVPVDGVDRVVVRQARDLESSYYLLKQFLADEELRATVLVPLGIVLLVFPALMALASVATAAAAMTAVIGLFLLYKGLGVDDHVADLPARVRTALYSGQVSIVTYVVAAGLALVGVFVGGLAVSDLSDAPALVAVTAFAHEGVPWLALAGLAASAGRLVDEAIRADSLRTSYLNLPFIVVAVGFVVRGFSGYFLERGGHVSAFSLPPVTAGPVAFAGLQLTAEQHLAAFVVVGVTVSLVGLRVATTFSGAEIEEPDELAK